MVTRAAAAANGKQSDVVVMHLMYFKAPIEKRICGAGSFFLPTWCIAAEAKSRHLHHLNDGCPPIFDTYDKRC